MNLLVLGVLVIAVPGWVLSAPTVEVLPNAVEVLDIPEITEQDAVENLESLGYGDSENAFTIGTRFNDPDARSELYRSFQRDYGLPQTGMLDEETKVAIKSPKCGLKKSDKVDGDQRAWRKNKLFYTISNIPNGKETIIRDLIRKAFGEWSKVADLDFQEVNHTLVDIEVAFGGPDHNQRDWKCKYNNPETLAHAFYPEIGDLHFNTNYFFDSGTKSLEDFYNTALHELGHSLGLEHSSSMASVMHPSASNQFTEPQPIDIQKIQSLYGARKTVTTTATPSAPKFCSLRRIDTTLEDTNGTTYAFSGDFYYEIGEHVMSGRPISSKWPGLTGRIDAVFQWTNGKTYFFKGDKFWRFNGTRLEAGQPRSISKGFPGLPSDIEAVMTDSNGDLVVLKRAEYWVYSRRTKKASQTESVEKYTAVLRDWVDIGPLKSLYKCPGYE